MSQFFEPKSFGRGTLHKVVCDHNRFGTGRCREELELHGGVSSSEAELLEAGWVILVGGPLMEEHFCPEHAVLGPARACQKVLEVRTQQGQEEARKLLERDAAKHGSISERAKEEALGLIRQYEERARSYVHALLLEMLTKKRDFCQKKVVKAQATFALEELTTNGPTATAIEGLRLAKSRLEEAEVLLTKHKGSMR